MAVFSTLLNGVLALEPGADALEFETIWYRWNHLAATIAEIRALLAELDLGPDTRVGVLARNRPSALAAVLTTIAADLCMVSMNPLLPHHRLAEDLRAARVAVVIGEAGEFERPGIAEALAEAGSAAIMLPGILAGARLFADFPRPRPASAHALAPGVIMEMLTSGTTGAPKRVALTRAAFETSFRSAMSYEKGRKSDDPPRLRSGTQILSNPITHIGGLWGALSCVLGGRKSCLLERFTVQSWHDAIVRHRPKVAAAVPAALRMILDANIPAQDLESLKALRTGTAPLDPALAAAFYQRYGIPVLQNYGATEFAGSVAGWTLPDFRRFHDTKRGSVGRFQPGVSGRIVDPQTGAELPAGVEGVLEMRASQFANNRAWLRTTDRATIDADGFLYISGRADGAIIRGGFKIHPDDVIRVLEQHPAVREAAVVGLDDRRLGAVPVAALILKSGAHPPSDAELAAFAHERLLPYQVPVKFLTVADLPRTPSLKPSQPLVRALFTQDADPGAL